MCKSNAEDQLFVNKEKNTSRSSKWDQKGRCLILGLLSVGVLFGLVACTQAQPQEITISTTEPTLEITMPELTEEAEGQESLTSSPKPAATPKPAKVEIGKIGQIVIDNTKVNYPIMLADDNEYYLRLDENGKRNKGRGSIYADYRNADPDQQRNIILYGHNLKDNTMFTSLHKFENAAFFEKNKFMDIDLFGHKNRYEIVYSGIVDIRQYWHIKTDFGSEEEFVQFFTEGVDHAQFIREGYRPEVSDEMITLSTCVSHSIKDSDDKRMIVVGRKIREADDQVPLLPLTNADIGEGDSASQAVQVPGEVPGEDA